MKRVAVLLITLALIAGMAACSQPAPPAEDVEIQTWYDLDDIRNDLGGSYILMNDLSAETAGYDELVSPDHNGGLGWEPIGTSDDRFKGSFDGQGYEISDLYINRPDEDGVGLFGYVQQGIVKNIGLVSVNVTGNRSVGALVGYSWKGTLDSDTRPPLSMTYSHGTVTGEEDVGGLVGNSYDGTVNQCESSAHVFHISSAPDEDRWRAGGLVGLNSGTVLNCDYNGEVNGDRQVGGLVGHNAILVALVEDCGGAYKVYGNLEVGGVAGRNMGSIRRASFAGEVNGILIGNGLVALSEDTTGDSDSSDTALAGSYIGGVVGVNEGALEECSAEATVLGYAYVGGLVGSNSGTVQNCISDSDVVGTSHVGGLAGANRGSVGSCSSSGDVAGGSDTGCLVGYNTGTVSDSDSTSWVIGTSDGGDLVGRNEGVVSGVSYELRVSSTSGGSVTSPGEGTYTYDYGAVVELVAEAKEGYRFVSWTGDVGTIADVNAAATSITISGDYSVTASFEMEATGAFLEEILITAEPDPSTAVQKLKDDALDVYAFGLSDPELYAEVLADPSVTPVEAIRSCNELTFNPVPFFNDGRFNPFGFPRIREAMNKLVDRDYIVQAIMGGLGIPKYTCLGGVFADAVDRYPHLIAAIESEYAYDKAAAEAEITAEMEAQGAYIDEATGTWHYDGEELEIIMLIRTEDARKEIGEYVGTQMESIGFKIIKCYRTAGEAGPLWVWAEPAEGLFHIYTGGWWNSMICRDDGDNFAYFYTDMGIPSSPLWLAYDNDPEFYEACEKLDQHLFSTLEEREALFTQALPLSLEDSCRIWLAEDLGFSPLRSNVRVAAALAGGLSGAYFFYDSPLSGSWVWALTAHFVGDEDERVVGGTMRTAMPDLLVNPWNPIAGSSSMYDLFPIRATGDRGLQPDPRDGLRWPGRIERAEVYVQDGLPMDITHDWLTLEFVPEIVVPPDAWSDWNAAEQRFITAAERFPEGTTALRKSTVYYPRDLYDVPLHDGSTISIGDFVMAMIIRFDRAKEESPIFDQAQVADFAAWLPTFKGVRIVSEDPLVIETYSDAPSVYALAKNTYRDYWYLDAEWNVTTWFPTYGTYDAYLPVETQDRTGFWHMITTGWLAEKNLELAFSSAKAGAVGVEWMDYTKGPSLAVLKKWLDWAAAENYIPYAPTLEDYISPDEAAERWANLQGWYGEMGHFWVGSGPFYLEGADTTEKTIHLKRFEDYPDPMDRWLFLLEPLP